MSGFGASFREAIFNGHAEKKAFLNRQRRPDETEPAEVCGLGVFSQPGLGSLLNSEAEGKETSDRRAPAVLAEARCASWVNYSATSGTACLSLPPPLFSAMIENVPPTLSGCASRADSP